MLTRTLVDLGGMPSPDVLRTRLIAAFPDARVEVTDLTGTCDHFQALVVTSAFSGRSRIEQHQLVYAALGELMKAEIHALALTTGAPEPQERPTERTGGKR